MSDDDWLMTRPLAILMWTFFICLGASLIYCAVCLVALVVGWLT